MATMKEQWEAIEAVADSIERLGPRGSSGDLCEPFYTWVKICRREVEKAKRWFGLIA